MTDDEVFHKRSTDSSPVSLNLMLKLELASLIIEDVFFPVSRIRPLANMFLVFIQIEYIVNFPLHILLLTLLLTTKYIFPWKGLRTSVPA